MYIYIFFFYYTILKTPAASTAGPFLSSLPVSVRGLGGSGWRLSGLSWGILARSWAILGELGVKLGPCWQHVGGKMAKMSEDMRTWGKMGG